MLPVPSEHANVSTNKATSGVGRVAGVALDSGAGCGCVLKLSDMRASIRTWRVNATMNAYARFESHAIHICNHWASVTIFNGLPTSVVTQVVGNCFVLVAQLDRASPSEGEGCAFDPHQGRFL